MLTTHILATVEPHRLLKATEGLVTGAYTITVTEQTEAEIRGFIANSDGQEYGVVLTEGHAFCSCRDAMYRKGVCKHAVALVLHTIRNPQPAAPQEERTPNLKLTKVRPGFAGAY